MQQLRVNASTSYDILIGSGLLKRSGEQIRAVSSAERAVIVTDDNVFPLYGSILEQSLHSAGFQTDFFVFPHGEASKSHQTLIALYDFLCDHNITRSDLLIALGGGVVGDLTGFCAATYLRGVDYVQIPTTLLAQIDSSVGGKTAVDTSRGKNLVGAFKQPALVLCDTDTLDTLSDEIFSDGMAEAIKYGLIKDKRMFELIAAGDIRPHLEQIIYDCVRIKAQVVEADEFDKGERMLLNFGHTIGHAIERQYQYETYTHGSAVGIGMVYISTIFEAQGLTPPGTTARIKRCLEQYNLPCSAVITPEQILQFSVNDKKRDKKDINLIVLQEIGDAVIHKVSVEEYSTLLQLLGRQAVVTPHPLSGKVIVPPSKSYAHRALIAAALADGTGVIRNVALSQDILATMDGLTALGARFVQDGSTLTVTGIQAPPSSAQIDCRESGSTLRFLVPVAAALGSKATFTGKGKLPQRPLTPYHEAFTEKGVSMIPIGTMPFTLTGQLLPGIYEIDGNISSQFITGLLFALPLLPGDSTIRLRTPLESRDYVQMTLEILALAGIDVQENSGGYLIKGNQRYRPFSYTVEGDYSQAAFFLTAGAIGEPVICTGLSLNSAQGDRRILDILREAGADVSISDAGITVSPGMLRSFTLDGSDIPDLIPILAVLAACCDGISSIHHIGRLKLKESDRIAATAGLLQRLGVSVEANDDSLTVHGRHTFRGALIDSYNDHRIAMSTAIASIRAEGAVTITGAQCIDKSYPTFFEDFQTLGGIAHVVPME